MRTVADWDEYTGRFEAVAQVDVRARVSGYLEEVHFRDGQLVEAGDLLFLIDPRPFEAVVARDRAELEQARTRLELARLELSRVEGLRGSPAFSQERIDTRRAELQEAQGAVVEAQAILRSSELNLEFTRIKAPIAGRISNRRVDPGNLISGGTAESTVLTRIVSIDPIYFVFDASESDYLRYTRLARDLARPSSRDTANPVYIRLMDEEKWTHTGRMDFVDNELRANTGTIRGRAVVENPNLLLVPGLFGRLRLIGSGEYQALLVPDAAVLSDQARKIVMTVDATGTVAPKTVTLGPVFNDLRVIRDGLDPADRVVVRGVQRARPGGQVTPVETSIQAPTSLLPTPPSTRG